MSMTKAEKAHVEHLETMLSYVRALKWPDYPKPACMSDEDIKAGLTTGGLKWGSPQKVAFGYFATPTARRVTLGCSDGVSHNIDGNTTSSQGRGAMYATEADAWRAIRHALSEEYARNLASVDAKIREAEAA
jgi:hypothetical protein